MNFKEAYKLMEEGKKIRRKGWGGYWFLNDGIVNIRLKDGCIKTDNFTQETIPNTLADDWEVVEERKVWKPRIGESFWVIDYDGYIYYLNDNKLQKSGFVTIGNCFKTGEEAKHMVEKLKVIKELQDFALENNTEKIDWENSEQPKFLIVFDHYENIVKSASVYSYKALPLNIYFTSKVLVLKAIEKVGEERIKKYYFDLNDEDCEKQKEEK